MSFSFTYPTASDNLNPLYVFEPYNAGQQGVQIACVGNCNIKWSATCVTQDLYWYCPVGNIGVDAAFGTFRSGETGAIFLTTSSWDRTNASYLYQFSGRCPGYDDVYSPLFRIRINNWDYTQGRAISTNYAYTSATALAPFGSSTLTATASTASSTSTAEGSSNNSNGGLSKGAIAGIAVGGVVVLVTLIVAILLWRRKRSKALQTTSRAHGTNHHSNLNAQAHESSTADKPELSANGRIGSGGDTMHDKSELSASSKEPYAHVSAKTLAGTSTMSSTTSAPHKQAHRSVAPIEKYGSELQDSRSQAPEQIFHPIQQQSDLAELDQRDRESKYTPYNQRSEVAEMGQYNPQDAYQAYQSRPQPAELGHHSRESDEYIPFQPTRTPARYEETLPKPPRASAPISPIQAVQTDQPGGQADVHVLKAQEREVQRQIEINESLQRLRAEQAALSDRILLAEMQARQQQ